jgi:hypothetical protein
VLLRDLPAQSTASNHAAQGRDDGTGQEIRDALLQTLCHDAGAAKGG